MTYLALCFKLIVYANYKINHILWKPLHLVELINVDIRNAVICEDEAYTVAEARASNQIVNRENSYMLSMSRKQHTHVIQTSQLLSMIDKRFRLQADVIIKGLSIETFPAKFKSYTHYGVKSFQMSEGMCQNIFPYFNTEQVVLPINSKVMEAKILPNDPKRLLRRLNQLSRIIPQKKYTSVSQVRGALIKKKQDYSLAGPLYDLLCFNRM